MGVIIIAWNETRSLQLALQRKAIQWDVLKV